MTFQIESNANTNIQICSENHVLMIHDHGSGELFEIPISRLRNRAPCYSFNSIANCEKKNIPLLPTPWAPHTAIFTSDNEDFFRRMPRVVIIVTLNQYELITNNNTEDHGILISDTRVKQLKRGNLNLEASGKFYRTVKTLT